MITLNFILMKSAWPSRFVSLKSPWLHLATKQYNRDSDWPVSKDIKGRQIHSAEPYWKSDLLLPCIFISFLLILPFQNVGSLFWIAGNLYCPPTPARMQWQLITESRAKCIALESFIFLTSVVGLILCEHIVTSIIALIQQCFLFMRQLISSW